MIDLSGAGGLVAAAWRADRAYLIDLAYRMLGDIGAAEDVVQEAFLRLDLVKPGGAGSSRLADSRDEPALPGPDPLRA